MKKIAEFFTSRMFLFFAIIGLQAVFFIWLAFQVEETAAWIRNGVWVVSILLALWITQRHENAAYRIGWILAVLSFPILGGCMYIFFRQRPLGKKQETRAQLLYMEARPYLRVHPDVVAKMSDESARGQTQSDYIYNASGFPLYGHTQTKYYPSGEAFFADLVKDLEKAERYIFMEYFIIEEGIMLDTILDILERKVKAGVDVRFMYDDIGCANKVPSHYYETLRARGIRCAVFNPLRPALDSRFNNRDHRKITVIDGYIAYTGGANLADEYINAVERFGVWKDGAVRLEGPATWSFLVMFLTTWAFTTDESLSLDKYIPDAKHWDNIESNGFVQPFSDSPLDDVFLSEHVYINMISKAQKYVYINTPYLDIGDELMTALEMAATSGVDVRITVPHIPDKKMVFLLTQSYFPRLIRAGVRIFEYTPGFIHTKSFVADDCYGVVGTINMDFRSLYLHWEDGVWMYRTSCLRDMKEDYLKTCEISQEIAYAMTQDKPFLERFFLAVLRVFGPLF